MSANNWRGGFGSSSSSTLVFITATQPGYRTLVLHLKIAGPPKRSGAFPGARCSVSARRGSGKLSTAEDASSAIPAGALTEPAHYPQLFRQANGHSNPRTLY